MQLADRFAESVDQNADRFAESAQLADWIAEQFHILPIALQSISNFFSDTNTTPYNGGLPNNGVGVCEGVYSKP